MSGKNSKTPKQLERYFKEMANHRRIEILFLIDRKEGITVEGVSDALDCNIKTISEHIRKLGPGRTRQQKISRS